jgi:hypothetical protein
MPTKTYSPLATVTLASNTSTITFSNIPATYRDLILVYAGTLTANNGMNVRFNGDTASNYTRVIMLGDGSGTTSAAQTEALFMEAGTAVSTATLQIMDYSATDKHKTVLGRHGPTNNIVVAVAGRWANTAAITSIAVSPSVHQMATGSTLSLYGIIG